MSRKVMLATVVFALVVFISSAQADPVALGKPSKPGLPECQAKVAQLEQIVAEQQATIAVQQATITEQGATIVALQKQVADQGVVIRKLEGQIATLQALLDGYENYAPVPQTGQTAYSDPYAKGQDDGALQMGVKWPVPRFTDNGDGTITDNLTRLVWLKHASCWQAQHWFSALDAAYNLKDGNCGLSDNSAIGDWRVPNRNELLSLVDVSIGNPCFPPPFEKVWEGRYWTSTTAIAYFSQQAWVLFPWDGSVSYADKDTEYHYLLPVRSGN